MMNHKNIDLVALARRVMTERGFEVDFSNEVYQQLEELKKTSSSIPSSSVLPDLRHLLWSSIDNNDSRDLDQIEVAESLTGGQIRVLVGIAHVDQDVQKGTPIDQHATHNTTSVYTGVVTFPMLPELLSTDRTSLNESQHREALVIDMIISKEGQVTSSSIYLALVENHAKLAYNEVSAVLEGLSVPNPHFQNTALITQLRLQDEAAQRLRNQRHEHGALELETIEAIPTMLNGKIQSLEIQPKNRARELIEDFMIASNLVMTRFFIDHHVPSIRRVVRIPKRWPRIVSVAAQHGIKLPEEPDSLALAQFLVEQRKRDPERFPDLSLTIVKLLGMGEYVVTEPDQNDGGHFGLAVQDYTHSTAPNRRYPDLITQRLLKACLLKLPIPYNKPELTVLAEHCTERANEAQKVERFMHKAAAALLLQEKLGEIFDAIVTGVSEKGTYVRLYKPPVEGRVIENYAGMEVGDKVRVKLVHVSPEEGFIDLVRV